MKRLFALVLAVLMVLSLVACANEDESSGTPVVTDGNVTDEADPSDTTTSEEKESVATTTEATTTEATTTSETTTVATTTTEDTTETELPSVNLTRGKVDGNVYSSDYSGLIFTKPENWVYATDEELNETMNLGSEAMELSEFQKAVANLLTVSDMSARDTYYGSSVSVSYENIMLSGSSDITEEEYLDSAKLLMSAIEEPSYSFGDTSIVELSGREFVRLDSTVTYLGIEFRQYMYVSKIDNIYMAIVSITLFDDTDVSDYEARFNKDYVEPETVVPDTSDMPRGTITETSYTNEYLGFKIEADGWEFESAEAAFGIAAEDVVAQWEEYYYVDDVYGINYDVLAEFTLSAQVVGDYYTAQEYLDWYKDDLLASAQTEEGFEYEMSDYKNVKLGNTEFVKFDFKMIMPEETWTVSYYACTVDGVLYCININVLSNTDITVIESQFVAV